jgi:hypothetical protein
MCSTDGDPNLESGAIANFPGETRAHQGARRARALKGSGQDLEIWLPECDIAREKIALAPKRRPQTTDKLYTSVNLLARFPSPAVRTAFSVSNSTSWQSSETQIPPSNCLVHRVRLRSHWNLNTARCAVERLRCHSKRMVLSQGDVPKRTSYSRTGASEAAGNVPVEQCFRNTVIEEFYAGTFSGFQERRFVRCRSFQSSLMGIIGSDLLRHGEIRAER